MKARAYDKRVQIYEVRRTSDGFGGYVTDNASPTLLETRWAKVDPVSEASASQLRQDYGLNNQQTLYRFIFREFTYSKTSTYLTYKGRNFQPLAVQEYDKQGQDTMVIAAEQ